MKFRLLVFILLTTSSANLLAAQNPKCEMQAFYRGAAFNLKIGGWLHSYRNDFPGFGKRQWVQVFPKQPCILEARAGDLLATGWGATNPFVQVILVSNQGSKAILLYREENWHSRGNPTDQEYQRLSLGEKWSFFHPFKGDVISFKLLSIKGGVAKFLVTN